MGGLARWHNAGAGQRQRQTKFKAAPPATRCVVSQGQPCPISPICFPATRPKWINTTSGRIFARVGGKGPPLLLLHGFSSTHVMWHRVAPQLADRFTLIIADLPGYGWSDMPESDKRPHALYQARDGADHGGGDGSSSAMCISRSPATIAAAGSSYRLALDHPGRLSQLAVLDILPTYNYWEKMNRLYALKIYHWSCSWRSRFRCRKR